MTDDQQEVIDTAFRVIAGERLDITMAAIIFSRVFGHFDGRSIDCQARDVLTRAIAREGYFAEPTEKEEQ